MARKNPVRALAVSALALTFGLACNLAQQVASPPPQDNPTAPPAATEPPPAPETVAVVTPEASASPIVHTDIPGSPPLAARYMTDRSSAALAGEHRSIADDFNNGFLERAFTSQSMDYKAYLDLTRGEISASGLWMYVTLFLEGQPPSGEPAFYGVEVDLDLDGRGDWLILGASPSSTEWTTDGVRVYQDSNHDVGAKTPVKSDPPPQTGNQYDNLVFDQGVGSDPDAAWISRSSANPNNVQIAFKASLINGDNHFLWGVWAFADPQPGWMDYQDHFSIEQAGSPLIENSNYPIKELALIDSTCRWGYDFNPTGSEPGACRIPPTPTPTLTPSKTPTPTWTPIILK